ncbi:MAG: PTS lactose/cellobiose transporter subunit IIA [Mycoplasmataceae bacterium]|nr:PTS lactose/cellobiose transporter subunit IIA [Mycoplasmataceae bacterium]
MKNKEETKDNINFDELSFKMIGLIGEAKFKAHNALMLAKKDDFKESLKILEESKRTLGDAGKEHLQVISSEAKGNSQPFKVIFMHAEDQYMTTQMYIDIVEELINILKDKKI